MHANERAEKKIGKCISFVVKQWHDPESKRNDGSSGGESRNLLIQWHGQSDTNVVDTNGEKNDKSERQYQWHFGMEIIDLIVI